jgi:hypothetical protein
MPDFSNQSNVTLEPLGQVAMLALFAAFLVPFFYLLYRAPRSTNRPTLRSIPAYESL